MITPEQRAARRTMLGSSEIPSVLGLLPFRDARGPQDVYLEKVGLLDESKGSKHTERGIMLEKYIVDWVEKEVGRQLERDIMKVHHSGLLCTNFDALVAPTGSSEEYVESVEAKSTVNDDGWGETGTDQVPPWVAAQVYHGFACLPSLKRAYVGVIIPGYMKFDSRLYVVERYEPMVQQIEAAGLRFMRDHVKKNIAPSGVPAMESMKRLKREPNKRVELQKEDCTNLEEWHELGVRVGAMEKRRKELAKSIIAALGDAEAGDYLGYGSISYMEIKRRAYECEATSYRKLSFKEDKLPNGDE